MPIDEPNLLSVLIGRDERTQEEVVKHFVKTACDEGEDATLSVRTLRRWLVSDVLSMPRPAQCRVARLVWGYSMTELLAPAPPEILVKPTTDEVALPPAISVVHPPDSWADEPPGRQSEAASNLERQFAMAAQRAARFTRMVEIDNIGPEALAQLRDDVISLANRYIQEPLVTLMGDLLITQETVFSVLEGRQKPAVGRDLLLMGGVVSGMIAKARQDLGSYHDAMTHARTAYVCADKAGVPALQAWSRGLQSLIAYWGGRPQEAVRYALRGAEDAAEISDSVAAWLPALEARAWAAMSMHGEATDALGRAAAKRDAHEPNHLDAIGGLFSFTPAKQSYYAAGTYVHLADENVRAQEEANTALRLFKEGRPEDRSFSDEAGARAELALARVLGSQIDGAQEALSPVLALAPERRIGGIVTSAARVHQALSADRFAGSNVTSTFREEIEAFCRVPAAAISA